MKKEGVANKSKQNVRDISVLEAKKEN